MNFGIFKKCYTRHIKYFYPKVIYDKKDGIETLNKEHNKQFGKMKAVYVYYDIGRGILIKCKKNFYYRK